MPAASDNGTEICIIYAAGYEITLKGEGLNALADLLLECRISKIIQGGKPYASTIQTGAVRITIKSIAWEVGG